MRKVICLVLCAFMVISLSACTLSSQKNIVLVTDETGINGNYYNKEAYSALNAYTESYGYSLSVVTPESSGQYENAIERAVEKNPAMVIISSPELELETILIAMQNLTVNFVIIGAKCDLDMNGTQDSPNIYSIMFDNREEGFLNGVCAGLLSDKILFIGEYQYASHIGYEAGFTAGLKCTSSESLMQSVYIDPSLDDESFANAVNEVIASSSCRLIYSYSEDSRIYKCASEQSISVISSGSDKSETVTALNDRFVFYVKENVDVAIGFVLTEYFQGRFKGQEKIITVSDEALSLEYTNGEYFSNEAKNSVNTYFYALHENEFKLPETLSEAKAFVVPSLAEATLSPRSLNDILESMTD